MGGKGGGGDTGGGSQYATGNIPNVPYNQGGMSNEYAQATADQLYTNNPGDNNEYRQQMLGNRRNYLTDTGTYDDKAWRAAKGGSGFLWGAKLFDKWFPEAPAAAAAPAPAPAAPAPAAPAPAAPDPVVPDPTGGGDGTPIDPGGGLGSELGGAILNPPAYWIGGLEGYDKAKGASTKGSLTTTQT